MIDYNRVSDCMKEYIDNSKSSRFMILLCYYILRDKVLDYNRDLWDHLKFILRIRGS